MCSAMSYWLRHLSGVYEYRSLNLLATTLSIPLQAVMLRRYSRWRPIDMSYAILRKQLADIITIKIYYVGT